MFADLIERLHRRQDLSVDEAAGAMQEIMAGRAAPAQIAGLLVALSMKGERPPEIVGLAKTMRANAVPLPAGDRPPVRHLRHRRRPGGDVQRLVASRPRPRRVRG